MATVAAAGTASTARGSGPGTDTMGACAPCGVEELGRELGRLEGNPRVVASGNFAAPHVLIAVVDASLPTYRLFVLNAQPGLPDREGVTFETAFVGPGMRAARGCATSRAGSRSCPPLRHAGAAGPRGRAHDAVRAGRVSLGIEVNILPAAVEAARARGGLVVAQVNPQMPYTFGDARALGRRASTRPSRSTSRCPRRGA